MWEFYLNKSNKKNSLVLSVVYLLSVVFSCVSFFFKNQIINLKEYHHFIFLFLVIGSVSILLITATLFTWMKTLRWNKISKVLQCLVIALNFICLLLIGSLSIPPTFFYKYLILGFYISCNC